MEKYLNEAIIGNKNMLATFSGKGEMLRLSYPNRDNRQYLKYFHTGVKINDSGLIYLHDDINNTYLQYYDTDTNILNTEITNTYFNLKVLQTDFAVIKEDILVKKYTFINESNIELMKDMIKIMQGYNMQIIGLNHKNFNKYGKDNAVVTTKVVSENPTIIGKAKQFAKSILKK